MGHCGQSFGRRLCIITVCIAGGALLYPYTFTSTEAVIPAAFFEQFCAQGAWGVIGIHLMELAPDSIRTFSVGTAYQLGNLASSASSTIEARLGERFPLPSITNKQGYVVKRYEYGKVICIFMGCVYAYVVLLTAIGPERRGRNLDILHDSEVVEMKNQYDLDQITASDIESKLRNDAPNRTTFCVENA